MSDVDMKDSDGDTMPINLSSAGVESLSLDADVLIVTVSKEEGAADYSTITDALHSQPAGQKYIIVVCGGVYEEGILEMREGVHITARNDSGLRSERPVVVRAQAEHPAVQSRVCDALLRSIRIEHRGPVRSVACVSVVGGNLRMEDCVVTGSAKVGVLASGSSSPTLNACQVERCCGDGIKVTDTASPVIFNCQIHSNDGFGIFCTGSCAGQFDTNEIYANSNAGVAVRGNTTGFFSCNKVYDGRQGGFWVEENSKCTLQGNDIYKNQKSGIQVGGTANPTVVQNIVRDGLKGGIVVHGHASGSFLQVKLQQIAVTGPFPVPWSACTCLPSIWAMACCAPTLTLTTCRCRMKFYATLWRASEARILHAPFSSAT